jgi:cytochrome P450
MTGIPQAPAPPTASATGRPLAEAPFVDPFDPEVQANADAVYADLRRRTAIVRTPLGASVLRREPMQRLLIDRRLVSAIPPLVRMQGIAEGPIHDLVAASVIAKDGEDHQRLRKLVQPAFSPRAANRHRDAMRELVDELVDTFVANGRCEFMADFADHYPVQVICEVLGVPREHHGDFARWGEALTHILSLELSMHVDDVASASGELSAYIDELVEQRRREPRDDLVTALVEACDGDDRLTPVELQTMIGGLLFAGYDTTRNQLGHAVVMFAQHPEQWELLARQPDLAPNAVNEVMRISGAVPGVPRIVAEDVEIDGWHVPAGTLVFMAFASANRDETLYENPFVFDITVPREQHITFGAGPHYCLGANLARAEMEEALRILPSRLPALQLDGEVGWRVGTGIVGPTRLPIAFGE